MRNVIALALILCLFAPVRVTYASGAITIDFTAFNVPDKMQLAVMAAIPTQLALHAQHFAVVSFQSDGAWALATVAAHDAPDADPEAVGMGAGGALIVLHRAASGVWQAAAEGTPELTQLAQAHPERSPVRAVLAALQPASGFNITAAPAPTLKFPWDRTQAWYFTQGWHYGNNVDFAPAHALVNKWVLAAHDGVVSRLCLGPLTVNLRITHPSGTITEYAHLDKVSVPATILGKSITQGQLLGVTYNLPFSSTQDMCGYSTGPHVHFKLPSQTTVVDGWQAHPNNTWTNAAGTVKVVMNTFPSTNVRNLGLTPRVFIPFTRRSS